MLFTDSLRSAAASNAMDPSSWRYRTWRFPDGTRVIAVDGAELSGLPRDHAQRLAASALDGILGAEVRATRFDEVLVEPVAHADGLRLTELR